MRVSRFEEPLGAATARARPEQPKTLSVGLFRTVIDGLSDDRRWVIVDLGRAHPRTLALLEGKRCLLDIADIVGDDGCVAHEFHSQRSSLTVSRSARAAEPADVVLCWDILNYLDTAALRTLMASVAARCRPGALVHALIVYSERVMHDRPGQIVPLDATTFIDVGVLPPSRPAPRYSTEALAAAMPEYAVERVRLLGNGMQEYLFKIRAVRGAFATP